MSSKSDRDNRANQLNPNNDAYYSSRGLAGFRVYDDDDYAGSGPTLTYGIPSRPDASPPRAETFAFGAVSLDGRAAYRTATFAAPGSRFNSNATSFQMEEYLEEFESLAHAGLKDLLGAPELAIFAVFDPTRSCLPWHVPSHLHDVEATRSMITEDHLRLAERLRPMPSRLEVHFRGLLSPEAEARADQAWQKEAEAKLDPMPFVQALRDAVVPDAPSWGTFELPNRGRMSVDEFTSAQAQLSRALRP
ncbi:hypothetical protein [Paraburkholderia metrosideri]|uniref:Uncharacterized protein n=1 Tax=Paraburkholderia metrosideri TaxID=580937 RepID=A0ABN7HPD2_9BURK|nr:hypothetical protein [Paraburkholderia metrosideri]CAD6525956.1 hypothetical protein LMG28140_01784 [Paraburkholderia metrosideri]